MLTDIGKKEAEKRTKIMIDFLYAYFSEEQANDWIIYLDNFLKQERKKGKMLENKNNPK